MKKLLLFALLALGLGSVQANPWRLVETETSTPWVLEQQQTSTPWVLEEPTEGSSEYVLEYR